MAGCSDLIKEFSTRTIVPVELDDVAAALVKRGVKDEIFLFLEENLDPTILEGVLTEWEYPVAETGQTIRVAHIDCAKSLDPRVKRLVVCKELLHLLDPDHAKVNNAEDFKRLTDSIGLPAEDQNGLDGKTVSDRAGLYKAIAVLFPWAAREAFKPHYGEKLDHEDIANIVDIPPRYAALVMDPVWEKLYPIFAG